MKMIYLSIIVRLNSIQGILVMLIEFLSFFLGLTENLETTSIETCPACALARAGRDMRKRQTDSD